MDVICDECGKTMIVQSNEVFTFCPFCRAPLTVRDSATKLMIAQQAKRLAQECNDVRKLTSASKLSAAVTPVAENLALKVFSLAHSGSYILTDTISADRFKLSAEEFAENISQIAQQLTSYFTKLDYKVKFREADDKIEIIIEWQ